ncbi:MAG: hypothetical protein M0C28_11275 [Candidatus Moduliflexus flocculans]|nr:hypothetical protein [Candidatus Moduliflexus flocculans]
MALAPRGAVRAAGWPPSWGCRRRSCVTSSAGALLHDIGKIGVSDTILLKPGKLTEDEWAVDACAHRCSARRSSPASRSCGAPGCLVAQHHERWDGRGVQRQAARRGDPHRGAGLRRDRHLRRASPPTGRTARRWGTRQALAGDPPGAQGLAVSTRRGGRLRARAGGGVGGDRRHSADPEIVLD